MVDTLVNEHSQVLHRSMDILAILAPASQEAHEGSCPTTLRRSQTEEGGGSLFDYLLVFRSLGRARISGGTRRALLRFSFHHPSHHTVPGLSTSG